MSSFPKLFDCIIPGNRQIRIFAVVSATLVKFTTLPVRNRQLLTGIRNMIPQFLNDLYLVGQWQRENSGEIRMHCAQHLQGNDRSLAVMIMSGRCKKTATRPVRLSTIALKVDLFKPLILRSRRTTTTVSV